MFGPDPSRFNVNSRKCAFVLTGGGSLGAVQVGMLRALMASGIRPDFLIGSSVGAVNACYFAGDPTLECIDRLEGLWCKVRKGEVFSRVLPLAMAWGLLRHPGSMVDPAGLRAILERNLAFRNIEDALLPVHVMATDHNGLGIRLTSGPMVDAVLASSAIPGIFPPVEIDGRALMDGAVAASSPIRAAVELGATRVIVLPTGYACALVELPRSAVARALHAITLMINWQIMHELERVPAGIAVHVVPPLCPLGVSPFDFSQSTSLINRARSSTDEWIKDGGLARSSRPGELAPHHHGRSGTTRLEAGAVAGGQVVESPATLNEGSCPKHQS